jgi:hypothetical protein
MLLILQPQQTASATRQAFEAAGVELLDENGGETCGSPEAPSKD